MKARKEIKTILKMIPNINTVCCATTIDRIRPSNHFNGSETNPASTTVNIPIPTRVSPDKKKSALKKFKPPI